MEIFPGNFFQNLGERERGKKISWRGLMLVL